MEAVGKTFNLARMDSARLGKMTKRERPKAESERVRSLERREIKNYFLSTPWNRKLAMSF